MIGENGGIKLVSKYDGKFLLQIYKLNLILYVAAAVIAIANLVFTICIAPVSDDEIIFNLVLAAVLVVCVLFLFVAGIIGIRRQLKLEKSVEFELFTTFMSVKEYEHGKIVAEGKIDYGTIVKSRVRGRFLVVDCGKPTLNGGAPYYILQDGLTAEEINTVRRLLKIEGATSVGEVPVSDGAAVTSLLGNDVNPDAEPINEPQASASAGEGQAESTGGEGSSNE